MELVHEVQHRAVTTYPETNPQKRNQQNRLVVASLAHIARSIALSGGPCDFDPVVHV